MDRLISEQAVLDAICKACSVESKPNKCQYRKGLIGGCLEYETVKAIPSAEPKWIPVSERLPKDEEYVLVCYEDGHIRTAYYYIDTSVYETEFEDLCETGWYNYNEDFMYKQDVVAWMPLPKPYLPDTNIGNMLENPIGSESEDKE